MTGSSSGAGDCEPEPPPLRVQGPADLVELVPYLVGFHPSDSVVVVAFDPLAQRVGLVLRADRADLRSEPELRDRLANHVARTGAWELVVVVVASGDDAMPLAGAALPDVDLVTGITEAVTREGLSVADALYVGSGRWWSYRCRGEGCCPLDGRPVRGPASRVAAEATYAGLVALPDRAALAAGLDPLGREEQDRFGVAVERAAVERARHRGLRERGQWREAARGRVQRALDRLDGSGPVPWLPDRAAGRLVVALGDVAIRDDAWLWMEQASSRWMPALELWRQLARRAPAPYRVPPLFLASWAAWRSGSGALARLAVERALEIDPDYGAAGLLEQAIAQGMDPRTAPPLVPPAAVAAAGCPERPGAAGHVRDRRGRAGQ
ncbi:MAG: DUF4192 domain-containing protein [Actinobacteria bacterium]|nr:DUF4192 domain-containing protein [Actinomycetota bacterium]